MKKQLVKGDPDAYGDWMLWTFEIGGFDLTECESALNQLLSVTQNMSEFLTFRRSSGETGIVGMYWIQFLCKSEIYTELDFFEQCAKYPSLHEKISSYVQQVNQMVMEGEHPQELWQDEMHPRGSYAIVPLVLNNVTYAPNFGRLFSNWDMEAETFQGDLVEMVIHKYGFNDSTIRLLALRCFNDGQATEENLLRILHNDELNGKLDVDRFITLSIEEISNNEKLLETLDISLGFFVRIYAGDNGLLFEKVAKDFSQRLIEEPGIDEGYVENGLVGELADGFEVHEWFGQKSLMTGFPPIDWNADLLDICVLDYLADPKKIIDLC